ncbi:MAG: GNAT family N-acetyltransferase [Cytophagaceae bacterium]
MKIFCQTERLILREILPSDDEAMFRMDSDKEVHKYLGNKPLTEIRQARENIVSIRQQYVENGIGRCAVIYKGSLEFMGWCGIKLVKTETNKHSNYYDIGYRFMPAYWGKGFATESARAALKYGFTEMNLSVIYGTALAANKSSLHVLEKIGLMYTNAFDAEYGPSVWLQLSQEDFKKKMQIQ